MVIEEIRKMTPKQMTFARAILAGKNARQAAIESGTRPDIAAQTGYRMMRQKDIAEYIALQKGMGATEPAAGTVKKKPVSKQSAKPEVLHELKQQYDDPKDFLRAAMNCTDVPLKDRIACAVNLMPYEHSKLRTGASAPKLSKKELDEMNANNAMDGIFGTASQTGTMQ